MKIPKFVCPECGKQISRPHPCTVGVCRHNPKAVLVTLKPEAYESFAQVEDAAKVRIKRRKW